MLQILITGTVGSLLIYTNKQAPIQSIVPRFVLTLVLTFMEYIISVLFVYMTLLAS